MRNANLQCAYVHRELKYYLYMSAGNRKCASSCELEINQSPLVWVVFQATSNAENRGFLPSIPFLLSLIPSWGLWLVDYKYLLHRLDKIR